MSDYRAQSDELVSHARGAWIREHRSAALSHSCRFVRVSQREEHRSVLVEGWIVVPQDLPEPAWDL